MQQRWKPWLGSTPPARGMSPANPMSELMEALTEQTRLRTLQAAANVGNGRGDGGALSEIVETAKSLGLDIPEMNRERQELTEKLENSRSDVQKAEFNARIEQMDRSVNAVIEEIRSKGDDPLQATLANAASQLLLDKISGSSGGTIGDRLTARLMDKFEADLDSKQDSQGPTSELAKALALINEYKEIGAALAPAPVAAPTGMSPAELLQLEFKKLDIEKEIAVHRINRETEAAQVRSDAFKGIVGLCENALQTVGQGLAEGMQTKLASSPERVKRSADDGAPEVTEAGAWINCPACGEQAIFVSTEMQQRAADGDPIQATCTDCGKEHTLGVRTAAAPNEDSSEPAPPPGRKVRYSTTGKVLPRFAVGSVN